MEFMKFSEAKAVLEKQEAAKAALAQYEKLTTVHEAYGFSSRREFIKALQELDEGAGSKGRGRGLSSATVNQIRDLKAAGKSNAEISRTLKVSPLTVGKYVKKQAGQAPSKPKAAAQPKARAKKKAPAKRKVKAKKK